MPKAQEAILDLLEVRGPEKTVCPSEAARLVAQPDGDWRECMDDVHQAVDDLVAIGAIALSWKGKSIDRRRGAYRIRRRRSIEE